MVTMSYIIKAFEDNIVREHNKQGIKIKMNKHFPTPPEAKAHCKVCKTLDICDCIDCGDNTVFAHCYRSKHSSVNTSQKESTK